MRLNFRVEMKPIKARNRDTEVGMKPTGVAYFNAEVKMKLSEVKMKAIKVGNLNIGIEMPETGVGNLVLFVKMKLTLPKM